jgi:WD40 repeat protein
MRLFAQIKKLIRGLAFAPDGKTLAAAADSNKTVGMWDLLSGRFRRLNLCNDLPYSLAYSPEGTFLAVGSSNGMALPVLTASGRTYTDCDAGDFFSQQQHPVWAMAFAPNRADSPVLATAAHRLALWKLSDKEKEFCIPVASGPNDNFTALAWAPDASMIAASSARLGAVQLWRLDGDLHPVGKKPFATIKHPSTSVAFAPTEQVLAVGTFGPVRLYQVGKKKVRQLRSLSGQKALLKKVAFHPNGELLASASDDGTVCFWDWRSGKQQACFDWQIGPIRAVAFAPDGMTCAAGGFSGEVVIWDVES